MYFCHDCCKQFQGGLRISGVELWHSYLTDKRTVLDLSSQYKCSERTIRRRLKLIADSFVPSWPKTAVVIVDTTYFSR
ncbi:MAG: transposase, partial [Prevotella sp.]|nr:transposase [Prevotella sp.]